MGLIEWLCSSEDAERITEREATYCDGGLICPRCEWDDWEFNAYAGKRELFCPNCGYAAYIADGVRLHR